MSEYIIEIPDEYFASYDTERNMYYPNERDSAMPITPFVRCRDCKHYNDQDKEGIMMESIGKLRELCAKWRKTSITPGRNSAADEVDAIADEIEREIAERYMKLPVDADGVPIHMDDMLKSENASKPFIVESMTFADSWTVWDRENGATRWPSECHHVKPRTIEDVLKEFGKAYTYVDGECASTTTLIADYADELRSMGVGDD